MTWIAASHSDLHGARRPAKARRACMEAWPGKQERVGEGFEAGTQAKKSAGEALKLGAEGLTLAKEASKLVSAPKWCDREGLMLGAGSKKVRTSSVDASICTKMV